MFDTNQPFPIQILSGGTKTCEVNFPSDEQWKQLSAKRKSIRRKTGRGLSDWEEPNREDAERELLLKVARDGSGEGFDKFEASKIVGRLSRAEVNEAEREGDEFRIDLRVCGANVTHRLAMPTMEERFRFERETSKIENKSRQLELAVNLSPAGEIWDRIKVDAIGYAEGSAIPLIHKAAAVSAVMSLLQELENDDPEA